MPLDDGVLLAPNIPSTKTLSFKKKKKHLIRDVSTPSSSSPILLPSRERLRLDFHLDPLEIQFYHLGSLQCLLCYTKHVVFQCIGGWVRIGSEMGLGLGWQCIRVEDEMSFVSRRMREMMGSCGGYLVAVVSYVENVWVQIGCVAFVWWD